MKKKIIGLLSLVFCVLSALLSFGEVNNAYAMPYYNLKPAELCERSKFYTTYYSSSPERIANIKLASSLINGTLLDVNEEFSFNKTVGIRSEERGFKTAKIILDGKFVDGVGGGVCQVSTTLYNAVLLANMQITEYHPHSLPVSYIAPSFDAMVNSYSSDLRFVNNTDNPIIIFSKATDYMITFTIVGQKCEFEISRESVIKQELPVGNEYIKDENNDFPDLNENEQKILSYGKAGYISEGYLIYKKRGKIVGKKRIRTNKYNSTNNVIIEGNQKNTDE